MTGGFKDGEVTILAARPSMGKTDCMLHFVKMAGWNGYLPIIFSLEMSVNLLAKRLIASTGNYNRLRLRNPYQLLSEHQKKTWGTVIGELDRTMTHIFDKSFQSIPEMRAKARSLMKQYSDRKPIIFIDYLTLIKSSENIRGNTHMIVSEISRNLKAMAKSLNCPVVCLAQLNRSVDHRADKRPVLSDIRESGSIEQDADIILFLYREKYYDKSLEDQTLEIHVAKNRNGPIGVVRVNYIEYSGKIEEMTDVAYNR